MPARRFQDYSQCCQGSTKCPLWTSSRNQSPAPQTHQLCIPAWVFWVPARISRAPASSHVLWNNFCCRAGLYTHSETIFVWQFGGPQPDLHVLRNNFQAIIQHYFNNFCICLVIFYIFWWFMARNMVSTYPRSNSLDGQNVLTYWIQLAIRFFTSFTSFKHPWLE